MNVVLVPVGIKPGLPGLLPLIHPEQRALRLSVVDILRIVAQVSSVKAAFSQSC